MVDALMIARPKEKQKRYACKYAHGELGADKSSPTRSAPVPVPVTHEPIIRGIRAHGFYVWRNGNVNKTTATSQ